MSLPIAENKTENPRLAWGGRLVVDAVFFQDWDTGIARVWRQLFREWSSRDFASRVLIVDRGHRAPRFPGFDYVDAPRFEYANDAEERQRLGDICRNFRANAFATTFYSIADGVPNLLLLHDMIPEHFTNMSEPRWQQKRRAIGAAAGFAAVSQNTMLDFKRYYPAEARRPTVLAPNGVAGFHPPTEEETAEFRANFCTRHHSAPTSVPGISAADRTSCS